MRVVGYRVADWDTPLWANPNRSPSRFWRPGEAVQYWSLHPLTPWAEHLRGLDLRDAVEAAEIRLRPWAAELDLPADTIELSFDTAPGHGLAPEALIDDDWRECQRWVAAQRPSAVLAPSAALAGTTNVVLFGPKDPSSVRRRSDRSVLRRSVRPGRRRRGRRRRPVAPHPLVRDTACRLRGVARWRRVSAPSERLSVSPVAARPPARRPAKRSASAASS